MTFLTVLWNLAVTMAAGAFGVGVVAFLVFWYELRTAWRQQQKANRSRRLA